MIGTCFRDTSAQMFFGVTSIKIKIKSVEEYREGSDQLEGGGLGLIAERPDPAAKGFGC
jgi:hypothetical protein